MWRCAKSIYWDLTTPSDLYAAVCGLRLPPAQKFSCLLDEGVVGKLGNCFVPDLFCPSGISSIPVDPTKVEPGAGIIGVKGNGFLVAIGRDGVFAGAAASGSSPVGDRRGTARLVAGCGGFDGADLRLSWPSGGVSGAE